jgi:hypothetical protein
MEEYTIKKRLIFEKLTINDLKENGKKGKRN